ncbi:MAG TPA: transcription antitermination factor NusB, partial [Candidatus Paceibacterota bacterium]
MANRHLSRSIVLQALFEWDFRSLSRDDARESIKRVAEEFSPSPADASFMEETLLGAIDHRADLDMVITKAAPEWPIDRISPIDRNVLRLGL